jgi:transcriptional regulator with XRE-family HTH domain
MDRHTEIRDFLRSRRARVKPEETGLQPHPGPRRVVGLRREELAHLAGISVDYYVRLEQGRNLHVSSDVLNAVAGALRLDAAERAYLGELVRTDRPDPPVQLPQRVRPGIQQLVRALEPSPAFIMGRRTDVLLANRASRALMVDWEALPWRSRNMARFLFLDPLAREVFRDWSQIAQDGVALLRLDAGQHPNDRLMTELVADLSRASAEFREWWASHDVRASSHSTKRFRHPLAGELTLAYEAVTFPADPDLTLSVLTASPGSAEEKALEQLISAPGRAQVARTV